MVQYVQEVMINKSCKLAAISACGGLDFPWSSNKFVLRNANTSR